MMLIFSARPRCLVTSIDPDLEESNIRGETPDEEPTCRKRSRRDRLPKGVCKASGMGDGSP